MNLDDHRLLAEKLGAFALGHLGDDERAELEAHLKDCPMCRAELEEILPVAALLPKTDQYRLEESLVGPLVEPPPVLDQRVYERVEQERRREARRRSSAIGWIAAAAAIVLVVFTLSTFFLAEEWGEQVSLRPVAERTELPPALQNCEADATLEGGRYSTQIELEAGGLVPGQSYAVWLERADGTRASAGGFQAYDEGPITVYLSAAVPLDEAVALVMGTPEGETGLRADLQGGDDGDLIVPDLRSRTLEDAIEAAGPDFEVDAGGDDGGQQPRETVVDQDPGPGDRARKGSTISATLSSERQTSEEPERTEADSSETEAPELESPEAESASYELDSGSDAETASDEVPASGISSAIGAIPVGETAGQSIPAGTGAVAGAAANVAGGPGPEPPTVGAREIEVGEASVPSSGILPGADGNADEGAGFADGQEPIAAPLGTGSGPGPSSPGTAPTQGTASGGTPLPEALPEAAPLPGDLFPSVPPLVSPTPPSGALLEEGQQPVLPTLPEAPAAPEVPAAPDPLQEPVRDALPNPLRDAVTAPDDLLGDGDDPTKGALDLGDGDGDGGKNDRPGLDALPKRDAPKIGGDGKGKRDRPDVNLPKKGVPDTGGGGRRGGGGPKLPALPR